MKLTYGHWFIGVFDGGPDDVRAMDAVLMAKLLGFIKPFSGQVLQLLLVTHSLLEFPSNSCVSG